MDDATLTWEASKDGESRERLPAVVLAAFPSRPERVGEVARIEEQGVLGRHGTLAWQRQRPGTSRPRGPLQDRHLSRQQLRLTRDGDRLRVENLGRIPLTHNGQPVAHCTAAPGDTLAVGDRVLLYVTERPDRLPGAVEAGHGFGEPDGNGILGESEAAWWLRERVAFLARRNQHVLITGASGTGKELVAQALHACSSRSGRTLVARNAATIPASLADAELFGNLADYPNPGMPGRAGLVGEADQSTLFLDELGELPVEQQARLLRVMDGGEYTRLGEARPRRVDLRVIAATNRDPDELKHDVLARFPLRIHVPPLDERREDIALLAPFLVRGIVREDAELAERFCEGGHPRLHLDLLHELLTRSYTTHIREIQALLWASIGQSEGRVLELPEHGLPETTTASVQPVAIEPSDLTAEQIQAVLDRHKGRQEPAWKELGLSSRHVLARLVKKHGLKVRGRS